MQLSTNRATISKASAIALLGISIVAAIFLILGDRSASRDSPSERRITNIRSASTSKRPEYTRKNLEYKNHLIDLQSEILGGRKFRHDALRDCCNWMESKPIEAIEVIYSNRQKIEKENLFFALSELLQHNNNWIELLSCPNDEKRTWLRDFFVSQFFHDVQDEGTLKALIAISDDKSSEKLRDKIVAGLSDGSRHQLSSLQDPLNVDIWGTINPEKRKMIEALAGALAYERPEYVLLEMKKRSIQLPKGGMERLATGFGQSNLIGGLFWLGDSNENLSGFSRQELSEKMVYEAMRHDSIAASQIVSEIQSPEMRDAAVCGIVSYLMSIGRLDDAEKWASSTTDRKLRGELGTRIADVKSLNDGLR